MPLFKRKEQNLIPPIQDPVSRGSNNTSPRPPSYRSNASIYNTSRDGDSYSSYQAKPLGGGLPSSPQPPRRDDLDLSGRNRPVDVYSRGQADLDQDRNALFSGYNSERHRPTGRFRDGPEIDRRPTPPPGEEEEEDVEAIKTQSRYTKQESVNSTRNALRMAREAEETARGTLGRLGDQSEKIANTQRHLDVSRGHTKRAEDKTDELKQLNRSIFRPVIVFNKDTKRAAQEAKLQERHDTERAEREKAMTDIRETQNRLGRAATYGRPDDDEEGIAGQGGRRTRTESEQALRKQQRARYQFESTASDDEMEDELDDNLNEISDMTKRLKAIGTAMGQELDTQNDRLKTITDDTDGLDMRLNRATARLQRAGR